MAGKSRSRRRYQVRFGGGMYEMTGKLFDGIFLGFLWILTSLPVITIGASTTALYYTVNKSLVQDREYAFRAYFQAFKQNFIQSTGLWIIIVVTSFFLHLNAGILGALTDGYFGLFFIVFYVLCSILMIAFMNYTLAAVSRFEMPTGWFVKLGLFMTMRYFLTTLAVVGTFACAALLFYQFPYAIFFLPVPVTLIQRHFIERVLMQHSPAEN